MIIHQGFNVPLLLHSCFGWKRRQKHRNVLLKVATYYQNETLRRPRPYLSAQIGGIFLDSASGERVRLGAASRSVFPGDPRAHLGSRSPR